MDGFLSRRRWTCESARRRTYDSRSDGERGRRRKRKRERSSLDPGVSRKAHERRTSSPAWKRMGRVGERTEAAEASREALFACRSLISLSRCCVLRNPSWSEISRASVSAMISGDPADRSRWSRRSGRRASRNVPCTEISRKDIPSLSHYRSDRADYSAGSFGRLVSSATGKVRSPYARAERLNSVLASFLTWQNNARNRWTTRRVRVIARSLVTLPRCVSNRWGINEIYRTVNKPRPLHNI